MAFVKALAYYLPERVVTNEQLCEELQDAHIMQLAKQAGISRRHVAATDETAGDMAVKAAEKMFEAYKIDRGTIDFLILCTQCPDYILPSTSCIIQDKLGLRTTIGAVSIDSGCSGFVYGLALANSVVESGLAKQVLLLTADTSSKNLPYEDKNRMLFGDASAATLIAKEGLAEIGRFVMGTDGSGFEQIIIRNGGYRHRSYNQSYGDWVEMDGEAVFKFTMDCVPPLMKEVIEKNNLTDEDVDYYILHQPNKFMLNMIRQMGGIPQNKFYNNLEETGNTTSSTIPIGVVNSLENETIHPGMTVLIAGFGIGLSWAGTLLKF